MGVKISALPTLTAITASDIIPFTDDGGATSKITFANFLASFVTQGTWTPALTFSTPGDLAVAYTVQTGRYIKIDDLVIVICNIQTSSFTHTTASGTLRINGLPFTPESGAHYPGGGYFQGITLASYTQFTPIAVSGNTRLEWVASGQGQAVASVTTAHMPTGGSVVLYSVNAFRVA